MEGYSNRRSKTEVGLLRRASRIPLRNQSPEERTNHISDGPGSSTRLNPMRNRVADNLERPRYLYDSFKSSSSKVPTNSSSFPLRKFSEEKRRQPLVPGVDLAECSRRKAEAKPLDGSKQIDVEDESSDTLQTEPEGSTSAQGPLLAPDAEGSHFSGSSGISAHKFGSLVRSGSLSSRTHRLEDKEVILGSRGTCSSFPNQPTIPGSSAIGVKPSYSHVSGVQRCGLNHLASTTPPDVQPSGCPSDFVHNRRFEAMRKRASDGESSSRTRSLSGPGPLGHSSPTYVRDISPRIRTTEQPLSQQIIRRSSRNHQDSAVSVRTRRSSPQGTRLNVSEDRDDHILSLHGSSAGNQQSDQSHFSFEEVSSDRSIRSFSLELPHEIYSSTRRDANTRTARRRPGSLFEESPPQMFHGLLGDRDGHRHITMDGIAEVLVALERIEQEAELNYEQLLVLETNLFLGAFASHDQHRDMRMDIDNMSYEELLALEERIGSVSTALSEEQFLKCLTRSVYSPVAAEVNKSAADDTKCSICQEEYMEGEEVGRLPCEHQYHVCCIHQWLRQKNWCPVCKASAVPSKK